ncbi:MAG: hypothetical protein CMJ87_12530, partial [Planctomycetes bacterium]|nr:hypothetical protein [Planctomycetota bacterium]
AGALRELVSPKMSQEILFRAGRRWGERQAQRDGLVDSPMELPTRVEQALRRLSARELGQVCIEHIDLLAPPGQPLVRARVGNPAEPAAGPEGHQRDAPGGVCSLPTGFLTGYTQVMTGRDLTCTPLDCSTCVSGQGVAFSIQSAADAPQAAGPAPSGSSRFFLRSLGQGLGEGSISLGDIVENTADAIVLFDRNAHIRFWNRGAEELFGCPQEAVSGKSFDRFVPPDLVASGELEWIEDKIEQDGALRNFLTRRVRSDGEERWVTLTRTVLHDSLGDVVGSTAILRDVTEQRRAEDELTRARGLALLGEVSAQVAHEIKNPLAGIYGAIQILMGNHSEDDPQREILENICEEVHRLDETVQDMLRYARPLPPKVIQVDLGDFLRQIGSRPTVQELLGGTALVVELPEDLVALIDPRLMDQTFTNLILNAAQAMDGAGTIRATGTQVEREVALVLEDDGPGIEAQDLEKITQPFFTTKSRGTGLGLPIAQKNVEAHGGKLQIESEVGRGTRVLISLPAGRQT